LKYPILQANMIFAIVSVIYNIYFQSLAHEIGHSVGINHDFKGSNTSDSRYDANGKQCINTGGIMDYAMSNENDQVSISSTFYARVFCMKALCAAFL